MDDLQFVYKTNETVRIPIEGSKQLFAILKPIVWIIVIMIILGSIFFKQNIFFELSWLAQIFLVWLIISVGFYSPKKKPIPSPIELRFFDDYLMIYRKKKYYNHKISRMEYNKFFYIDLSKIEYEQKHKMFFFTGKIDAMWFDYNKDGSVPNNPTYHKITEGGICYFRLNGDDAEIILEYIEKYTGVKPIVKYKQDNSK